MSTAKDEHAASSRATRPARPLGRKRDHTRDAEILQAARDVLAETGYEGMTIDMVAARAKAGKATVYRRWATKEDLVLAAVACLKDTGPGSGGLPRVIFLNETVDRAFMENLIDRVVLPALGLGATAPRRPAD